jgi:hypothetical protein
MPTEPFRKPTGHTIDEAGAEVLSETTNHEVSVVRNVMDRRKAHVQP